MPKPTLQEIYAMPPHLKNDNFDMASLHTSAPENKDFTASFNTLRTSLMDVQWEHHADASDNRIVLTFIDILGDQAYLNAHAFLKGSFDLLTLNAYAENGEVHRGIKFANIEFVKATSALAAADGKETLRKLTFSFSSMDETHYPVEPA